MAKDKDRDKEKNRESGALSAWDPFGDVDLLEGWPRLREWGGLFPRLRQLEEARLPLPAVDVDESDERYTISAEIPGISRDEVQVECHEGVLSIRGEKRSEREEKGEKRRWTERSYGSFRRAFRLPSDADPDRIEATFKDGVLTVTVARSGEQKPRSVVIKS
jgi:HSP20 family protein